jgi:hypothetical protein
MNWIQAVFCNQYEELVRTGRDGAKAKANGLILCSAMILVNFLTFFFILQLIPHFKEASDNFANNWVGSFSGKTMGKILGIILFSIIYMIFYQIVGKNHWYENTIRQFNSYPIEIQKSIAQKGMYYVIGSIVVFLVVFLMNMVL